jgi:hypothetical protein
MTTKNTSTGGTVTLTKTGLVHKAGSGAYSGRVAELGMECKTVDAPKRGRGRPPKVSSTGVAYDFTALLGKPVKVPKWKGNSVFHSKPE